MSRWRYRVFVLSAVVIFVVGIPFLQGTLETRVSRGLAFVLASAAFASVFAVLGRLLFGPTQTSNRDESTRPGLRALLPLIAIAACASWGALAYIETNALSQPDHAQGLFQVAVHLKGVVRYMTAEQYAIDQGAMWAFASCVLLALGVTFFERVRRRRE